MNKTKSSAIVRVIGFGIQNLNIRNSKQIEIMSDQIEIPEGFEPLFRTSPFLDTTGPYYSKMDGKNLIVGMRILDKHINGRGFAHAGVFMTISDVAIGYAAAFSQDPPANLITISLNTDFVGSALKGDWIEVRVDIQKIGKQVAFANAFIYKGEERIVRVNAVFAVYQKT
jgi:acyl-coenzyme A thioesterase 13